MSGGLSGMGRRRMGLGVGVGVIPILWTSRGRRGVVFLSGWRLRGGLLRPGGRGEGGECGNRRGIRLAWVVGLCLVISLGGFLCIGRPASCGVGFVFVSRRPFSPRTRRKPLCVDVCTGKMGAAGPGAVHRWVDVTS